MDSRIEKITEVQKKATHEVGATHKPLAKGKRAKGLELTHITSLEYTTPPILCEFHIETYRFLRYNKELSYETNLSAEQNETKPQIRLPRTNEDQGRSKGSCPKKSKGQKEAFGCE